MREASVLLLLLLTVLCGGVACACEMVLTHAKIASEGSRALELFGPHVGAGPRFGYTVNGVGDVNGDGFDDFAVASPFSGIDNGGEIFLVFGRNTSAWASATFDFNATETPDPASWIKISALYMVQHLGFDNVASGDFNGDGLSDVLFGLALSSRAYCVFGHRDAWHSFNYTEVGSSVLGFYIRGALATNSEMFVGNAGDLNGDGIEDILVAETVDKAMAHVVFGKPGNVRGTFYLNNIDGTNGVSFEDGNAGLGYGKAIGSAGDVNGDGLPDLAVGNPWFNNFAGRAYVVFARNVSASGQQWPATFNLTSEIDGTNGFIVDGPISSNLGITVIGAGDVNADGFADVFIGSSSGSKGAWIVFGHAAPWTSPFSAMQLDGTNGFHFASETNEWWGYSGGGAGDVNGDGFDDVVIGGYRAVDSLGSSTGAAAILFGHSGAWAAELGRNDAVGSAGFLIDGPATGSNMGYSARGAGDVNGDGLADVVVGAINYNLQAGYAVLVFGVDDHCAVCSNTTNACLACDDGFILNGIVCTTQTTESSSSSEGIPLVSSASSEHIPDFPSSSASSAHQQGVSVVVIIKFNENISDPTELQEEIASVLGIDVGLVSVVVISPTEVEVTIIGSEETAQQLVEIINNGGVGSSDGSGLGLLRKAIDAHIRKDTDDDGSSDDDEVDTASRVALPAMLVVLAVVANSL